MTVLAEKVMTRDWAKPGNNTLAAWLIHPERSSVVGSRPDAGCFNRSTEDAPPRQLG